MKCTSPLLIYKGEVAGIGWGGGSVDGLIIDDLLITALSETERRDLLEIVENYYGSGATGITSQLPTK